MFQIHIKYVLLIVSIIIGLLVLVKRRGGYTITWTKQAQAHKAVLDTNTIERIVLDFTHRNGVAPTSERLKELIALYKEDYALYKAALEEPQEKQLVEEYASFVHLPIGKN